MRRLSRRSPRRRPSVVAALVAFTAAFGLLGAGALASTGFVGYLLRSGEQPGFHLQGRPVVFATVAAYIRQSGLTGRRATQQAQLLRSAGYTGGAEEQLAGAQGLQAFSLVGRFARRSGATTVKRSFLAQAINAQKGGGAKEYPFSVPGVPGAAGVTVLSQGVGTANVYWTEGSCSFGSGLYLPSSGRLSPGAVAAPVITGVQSQHRRTRGRCS